MGRGAISPDLVGLKSDIMKHVGLQGGSSIFELGAVSDMRCFFSIINSVGDRVLTLKSIWIGYIADICGLRTWTKRGQIYFSYSKAG